MDIFRLLQLAKVKGASDVHLAAYSPPLFRIDGELEVMEDLGRLMPDDIGDGFGQISSEQERAEYYKNLELDVGYTVSGVGRIRCNAAQQRGTLSFVIRLLPPI